MFRLGYSMRGTRSRTNSAYGAALGVFIKQKLSNHPFTVIGRRKEILYMSMMWSLSMLH